MNDEPMDLGDLNEMDAKHPGWDTPTPRTDAAEFCVHGYPASWVVPAADARGLEWELIEAKGNALNAERMLLDADKRLTEAKDEIARLESICTDHYAAMSSASLVMARRGETGDVRPGALIVKLQGELDEANTLAATKAQMVLDVMRERDDAKERLTAAKVALSVLIGTIEEGGSAEDLKQAVKIAREVREA